MLCQVRANLVAKNMKKLKKLNSYDRIEKPVCVQCVRRYTPVALILVFSTTNSSNRTRLNENFS